MWTLPEAILVLQELEPRLRNLYYHCGLTGSVLYYGSSAKDLDIIIYPHSDKNSKKPQELLELLSLPIMRICEHDYDSKIVMESRIDNRRVDFFFLQ